MYAVFVSGGKQHRVEVGSVIRLEALEAEAGASVAFDQVLLVGDGASARVGSPTVAGAVVRGTVVEQGRGKKIAMYTFKRRQNANRRRRGHRQAYTAVKIEAIQA